MPDVPKAMAGKDFIKFQKVDHDMKFTRKKIQSCYFTAFLNFSILRD
jgi:hypothetical protein